MWEVIIDTREGEWSASSTGRLTPGQLSLYTSDSQPGVRVPQGIRIKLGVGKKRKNNGGKRHIYQQCKTRYKSKVVKLIERYDEWRN